MSPPVRLGDFRRHEIHALLGIGQALALRNMGLVLVIPVLPLIAVDLEGSTPFLVGLAIGAYGLTQALLQIPFGWMSDRWGRKWIVEAGLLFFLAGNVVAGLADHISLLILGRAVMGAGAIASVCNAWTADVIPPGRRAQAFGVISLFSSAASFLGFLLGPVLYAFLSLSRIFFLCAALTVPAALGIAVLEEGAPGGPGGRPDVPAGFGGRGLVGFMRDQGVWVPNVLGFLMNYFMTSLFLFIPLRLKAFLGPADFWKVITPAIVLAVLVMFPAMRAADRGRVRAVLRCGLLLEASAAAILLAGGHFWILVASLFLFVTGYLVLAPTLPSYISRRADPDAYGAVMGTYAMFIFAGSFCGAPVAGLLYGFGTPWFSGCFIALALVGLALVGRLEPPRADRSPSGA